jgi:antirestriction protein
MAKDSEGAGSRRRPTDEEVWEFLAEHQQACEEDDSTWFDMHVRDAFTVPRRHASTVST